MALATLSGDEQCIIFSQLCNVLDPGVAVAFGSASSELWALTQAERQQLRADYEAATALCLRIPILRHSAVATSWSALSCWRSACVSARSSLLALPKATATPGSSTLHSWTKMTHCSSPLSVASAIAARAGREVSKEGKHGTTSGPVSN